MVSVGAPPVDTLEVNHESVSDSSPDEDGSTMATGVSLSSYHTNVGGDRMIDCESITEVLEQLADDPRIDERYIRCIDPTDNLGAVLLLGVVHDHPASEYRVRRVLEHLQPDILALELPPLAVSLFSLYADDPEVPPQLGGEMSTAIQGSDADVIGIDAPNWRYLKLLFNRWRTGSVGSDVGRPLLRDIVRSSVHSIVTLIGAYIGSITPYRLRLYSPIRYEISPFDPAEDQAHHEGSHIEKREAFLNAIEMPPVINIIDELREEAMIDRLNELRRTGTLVGVIGMEHLAPVHTGLSQGHD